MSFIFSFVLLTSISFLVVFLNNLVHVKISKHSNLTPFECGFISSNRLHKTFNLQVFMILVVFVCFDLEVVFLVISLSVCSLFWLVVFFYFMLFTLFLEC